MLGFGYNHRRTPSRARTLGNSLLSTDVDNKSELLDSGSSTVEELNAKKSALIDSIKTDIVELAMQTQEIREMTDPSQNTPEDQAKVIDVCKEVDSLKKTLENDIDTMMKEKVDAESELDALEAQLLSLERESVNWVERT